MALANTESYFKAAGHWSLAEMLTRNQEGPGTGPCEYRWFWGNSRSRGTVTVDLSPANKRDIFSSFVPACPTSHSYSVHV